MIKILFFIETLTGGGAEKVLRDLVNHMNQTKFDITVQTVWPCDASKYLVPGIRYKSTFSAKNRINQLKYRAEAETGILYALHINDEYDIECAYLEMGPTKVMAASINKKAKKLAWVHCDLSKALSNPESFVKKTAPWYAKFDRILCVSKTAKESFDKLFCNQFHSSVLYNVVDDRAITEKSLLPKQKEKRRFTVLAVGRLTTPKNYLRLMRTHRRMLEEGLEHDLWILGEGSEREKLEAYVTENKLEESVWMPGFIDNPYPYMRTADLLVCSSIFEGFSTFVTEGIVLGKPIVTTEVSGMRELLGDSEYGLIVDNNDEAFYLGMKKMLTDPALRTQYAKKAEEHGKAFSAAALTEKAEELFVSMTKQ